MLGLQVALRKHNYGECYDGVLVPLINLCSIQRALKKANESIESAEIGIEICKEVLARKDLSEVKKAQTSKMLGDFFELLYHQYAFLQ